MARRLHAAGTLRAVYNRSPGGARAFAAEAEDVHVCASPRELAEECDVVITMLGGPEALRSVVLDEGDGLLAGAARLGTIVDMSTVGPRAVEEVASAGARAGVEVVDAPVSGSVPAAESGTLVVFAGGDPAVVDAVRPLLEPIARAVHHVGPRGSAATLKLAVNGVLAQLNQAVAEAMRLLRSAGVDEVAGYDAMLDSAVAAPYLGYKRQAFLGPGNAPVAFTLEGLAKDARLALEVAAEAGIAMPGLSAAARELDEATATGRGGRDIAEIVATDATCK